MTTAERKTISRAWLRVGEDALDTAEALGRTGRSRSCVSRAYYATDTFLSAALILQASVSFQSDREGPEHGNLSDLAANHLKGSVAPSALSSIRNRIVRLYQARLDADYRPRRAIHAKDAVESMKIAKTIANVVRSMSEIR